MRIHTECMSFKNCWTISSSIDFQAHQQHSKRRCWFFQTALLWFEVLPELFLAFSCLSPALRGAPRLHVGAPRYFLVWHKVLSGTLRRSQIHCNHSHCTPIPVIRDPSYSEGRPKYPPSVWYSPEIDASRFTLHILPDTPGGFQWLKYILLMYPFISSLYRARTSLSQDFSSDAVKAP